MATTETLDSAAAMGRRRGELFRDTGLPSQCPFAAEPLRDLAAVWTRSYFTALWAPPAG